MRPLSKLAEGSEVRGDAEHRTGVYTPVHEDSSTASTKQFTSSVEFEKRSIIVIDRMG
ncbi:palindromic element RPE1 domain-containing protein [Legionella anisa]|nr:palindromic element RPE1 domain-containing protein [Legionella anisa]MCW8423809.1 palindromic element RPE1 domain-containing protein [Legionella anisa]MCW8447329.1 palindromic element RPE1 domain-containing protein [Legionella anisa]